MTGVLDSLYKQLGHSSDDILSENEKRKLSKLIFQKYVDPKLKEAESSGWKITLSDKDLEYINETSEIRLKKYKSGTDNKNLSKRWNTGLCVEYALFKKYKKLQYFDRENVKNKNKKYIPDLAIKSKIISEIKGSFLNNFPLVTKKTQCYKLPNNKFVRCSNIIGVTDHKNVWILGIASPEMLRTYIDDNLILMSINSNKTAYYGISNLLSMPRTWMELKKICNGLVEYL